MQGETVGDWQIQSLGLYCQLRQGNGISEEALKAGKFQVNVAFAVDPILRFESLFDNVSAPPTLISCAVFQVTFLRLNMVNIFRNAVDGVQLEVQAFKDT